MKRARPLRWLSSWQQREFARRQLYLALAKLAPEAIADLEERGLQRLKDAYVGRYVIAPAAEWPGIPPLGPFARLGPEP